MATKNISKDTLKVSYFESKKRIKIILQSISKYNQNNNHILDVPDPNTCKLVIDLCHQIHQTSLHEPQTQYSQAIVTITQRIDQVLQKDYLKNYKKDYPQPMFVVKKGAEILHSFLYRDLRRKQFSSEENEIYSNYLALTRKLPALNLHEKIL